jgi:hypothetical protein
VIVTIIILTCVVRPKGARIGSVVAAILGVGRMDVSVLVSVLAPCLGALFAGMNAAAEEIEPRLPLQLFCEEWRRLEDTKAPRRLWPLRELWAWMKGYHELGTVERIVPLAFAAIYVAELIRQAAS